jgi:hypothetical protein
MDFSWSGMRDYAYEVLESVQIEVAVPDTELFTEFKEKAAAKIATEIAFGTLEDALQILGKSREDFDKAEEEHSLRP